MTRTSSPTAFASHSSSCAEAPEDYEALCTVPIPFCNRSAHSDFRHSAPMFDRDASGAVTGVRWSPWLRGPIRGSFAQVDAVYRGLRRAFRLAEDPLYQVTLRLRPGDLLAFDNRRDLHGRAGYDPSTGSRKLVGCYVEREALDSGLRMAARQARRAEPAR